MRRIACFVAVFVGTLVTLSCTWPNQCNYRDMIYVKNQTDIPFFIVIEAHDINRDESDTYCISPEYEKRPGGGSKVLLGYSIEPNNYMQRMANLIGYYDIATYTLFKKPTCRDYAYSGENPEDFSRWQMYLYNLVDTTRIAIYKHSSVLERDTSFFDESYKEQSVGLLTRVYSLVIDLSILRSMKKDTTMLSRFPEYYGR